MLIVCFKNANFHFYKPRYMRVHVINRTCLCKKFIERIGVCKVDKLLIQLNQLCSKFQIEKKLYLVNTKKMCRLGDSNPGYLALPLRN